MIPDQWSEGSLRPRVALTLKILRSSVHDLRRGTRRRWLDSLADLKE